MKLDVWGNGHLIGRLSYDGRFSFTYDEAWRARKQRFALCPGLPIGALAQQTPDQHSAAVRRFFENLLPEGQALDDASRAHNVAKNNVAGLLHALGRETSGALSFSLAGREPVSEPSAPRLITQAELSQRIRERPEFPFSVWDRKIRLSIAGYQDKLAVFEDAGAWYLVDDPALASTRILKPEPVRRFMAGMTSNELMCLQLARAVGLPTASARLQHVPEPVLVVERFDRIVHPGSAVTVERLHCIDGCQALGLPVDFKYERPHGDGEHVRDIRDGASVMRFFALLGNRDHVSRTGMERLRFLRWVIFQVLIGNTDAHAKNVSFFSDQSGLSLAPTYDLVCGLVYAADGVQDYLAMAIGDNFKPTTIGAFDWAQMAWETGLSPRLVANEIVRLASQLIKVIDPTIAVLREQGADGEVMKRIAEVIRSQCAQALAAASGIPAVDKNLF